MAVRTAHIFEEKWRSEDVRLQEGADFDTLLLPEKILAGLKKAGYERPSPIQLEAIPRGRFGEDLVVQAKAGTGKTLVFSIVALEILISRHNTQVLILVPTREIAVQICSVIQSIGSEFHDLKCCYFIGGTPLLDDIKKAKSCQIAVGTPGRMSQLIKYNHLKTPSVRLLILDEVDRLMDHSLQPDVDLIFKALPIEKQVIATSVTYPKSLRKLVNRYFRKPFIVRLNEKKLSLLGMVYYTHMVENAYMAVLEYKQKLTILKDILDTVKFAQCLIFCNLVSRVEDIYYDIQELGFSTTYISRRIGQVARLDAIQRFKQFKVRVLVSSDLTSRGIDVENVDLVVNFDIPESAETFLHRVGRAGRYGTKAAAITLLIDKDVAVYQRFEAERKFQSFILPDPIPGNLINLRTSNYIEINSTEESSSDDSTTPNKVSDHKNIKNEHKSFFETKGEEIVVQNRDSEDNFNHNTKEKSTENLNEDRCTNNKADVNEDLKEKKLLNSAEEEKPVLVSRKINSTNRLIPDSSCRTFPRAPIRNLLMLYKALKKQDLQRKNLCELEKSSEKISPNKNPNRLFSAHNSQASSESSVSSSKSSTSSESSTTSSFLKPSTSLCEPPRVSFMLSDSSSESSSCASNKLSSMSSEVPDQIAKQYRKKRYERSSRISPADTLPSRQFNRHKIQQSRHKCPQKNASNRGGCNISGNVKPNYRCSHGVMFEASMPYQGVNNMMHMNAACAQENKCFASVHYANPMHSNCFRPSYHTCYPHHTSCYKSCIGCYRMFQKQWEDIHSLIHFQLHL